IDHVTLLAEVYDDLNSIGGPQTLIKIEKTEVEIENFKVYEKELIEKWQLTEIKRLQKQEITSLEQAGELKAKIEELSVSVNDEEYNHQEEIIKLHQEIEEQPEGMSGYDTGFTDLNNKLDGLQREDLIVIAGRPSTGKTAF